MGKRVIVIGAGIAGLSAGIWASRSGFDVTILEQHTIPGGMCTGWRRKGYCFDGAMHWLTGSSPNAPLHALWREVGALSDDVSVRYDEVFRSVEYDGTVYYLYRDLKKLQAHFDEISPEDRAATARLVSDIRAFTKMKMPVMDIKGVRVEKQRKMPLGEMLQMLPALPKMKEAAALMVPEYIERFRHPALRALLGSVVTEDYGAISMLFTLATVAAGDGGYPEGGSLAMAQRIADRFSSLGGKILYGTKAEQVVTRDGAAIGVRVAGETMPADAVIVTQETLAAAEQLFDTPPQDEWLARLKAETKPAACCFVCIGVRAELKDLSAQILAEPIRYGDCSQSMLAFNSYWDYPGYAPEGCTALTTSLLGDSYDFWKRARLEGRYEAEKQALGDRVVRELCKRYPQAEGKIDVVDVATPLTYERYTGASRGSWMSIMGKGAPNMQSNPCALEGIDGVYFAGHRTKLPGGMPIALTSGRDAAQMVCRQFGEVFR